MTQAPSDIRGNGASPPAGDGRLRVVVSLDVEEEGLFSGRYAATDCTVRNVSLLPRLAPLTRELGFPLTLLCTYAVFMDAEARVTLARMRDSLGAEIGAHLHHWSTPPIGEEASPPVPTDKLPPDLFRARLRKLLKAGRDFQGEDLRSFRMGRWDLKPELFPVLAGEGLKVDSSVCPLRMFKNGPDHFLAPPDPYWPDESRGLLEVPVTQLSPVAWLPRAWHAALKPFGERGRAVTDAFRFWGAVSANPIWHCSTVMNLAASLHVERGGRVLCLFWHSSEMLPGASPHTRTQEDADALLTRIYDFLRALREKYDVLPTTLGALPEDPAAAGFPVLPGEGADR